jgi:PPOX class probable F420-dependent enzyme
VSLTEGARALFEAPNYVHLTTLRVDGSPRNWVVWVGVEGHHLLVCTGRSTWKARDMLRDSRVSLSVTDRDDPYRMAAVQGRVVEVRDDEDSRYMDPIAIKYTSEPFPARGPGRCCFVIEALRAGDRQLAFTHDPG